MDGFSIAMTHRLRLAAGERPAASTSSTASTNPGAPSLVERARHDREAFAQLYREHYPALGNYLYRRTGDSHATEDLLADVFLAALRAVGRFESRGVPFRVWLMRIATHAANRWARREQRRPVELAEPGTVVDETARTDREPDRADERAWVQRCLLALPPRFQSVIALHYVEGLSVQEVARTLGCRPGTVMSRLSRGRALLERTMARSRRSDDRPRR